MFPATLQIGNAWIKQALFGFLLFIFNTGINTPLIAQKNIAHLIHEALSEADRGFPSFINDTVDGYDGIRIKSERLDGYAGVEWAELKFKPHHVSTLMNGASYQLNQMSIKGPKFVVSNKEWDEIKDSVYLWYKGQVDFFTKTYASLLTGKEVIARPEDQFSNIDPPFSTFLYHKSVQLPADIKERQAIKRYLDVAPFINITLYKPVIGKAYYVRYDVCGATKE